MINQFTKGRYKALELLSEYLKTPSRQLKLDAIITDIPEEDLRWVTEHFHYYALKLLEEVEDKVQRQAEI
tara:strand:+ start:227 stop:436 length:210 start_codon:yes stop_codon:yes gene_type:complete